MTYMECPNCGWMGDECLCPQCGWGMMYDNLPVYDEEGYLYEDTIPELGEYEEV